MNETTFENAVFQDRVWDKDYEQWGTVLKVLSMCDYPISVCLDNGIRREYTVGGRYDKTHKSRVLFWDKVPEPVAPPRPKRIVKKKIERWANIYPNECVYFAKDKYCADRKANEDRIACVKVTGEYFIEE